MELRLATLRKLLDRLAIRHVVVLNQAASVRAERYHVVEGKIPKISTEQARTLLKSIDSSGLMGLHRRAVLAVLVDTAARVWAVASLTEERRIHSGSQSTA